MLVVTSLRQVDEKMQQLQAEVERLQSVVRKLEDELRDLSPKAYEAYCQMMRIGGRDA